MQPLTRTQAPYNTTYRDERFDHISSGFYREIIGGTVEVASASQSGGTGTPVNVLTLDVVRGIFTISGVTITNTSLGTGFFNAGMTGLVYTISFTVTLPQNLGALPSIALSPESDAGTITNGSTYLINSISFVADEVTTNSFLVRAQIVVLGSSAAVANNALLGLLLPPSADPLRLSFVLKLEATQNSQGVTILPQ